MMLTDEQAARLWSELKYSTSRAGGKGGQNVNKVETKVELELDVPASEVLTDVQKQKILSGYKSLVDERLIKITSSENRTQLANKEEARRKLLNLLNKLLKPVKKRLATKPSKSSREKKLRNKKLLSEKKNLRQKPN